MASVNKVILIGNVGKEPDVRYLENDVRVASFPLATTERGYTMSNGTQVPDRTEWHTIVVWRNLAEIAEKYIHKSTRLYVEGKLRTRTYENPTTGVRRYITEVYAENIQFLSTIQQNQQQSAQPATQGIPAQQVAAASEETVEMPETNQTSVENTNLEF